MNIYLAGLIGAGKTTVGKELATYLNWTFDDLDPAMERDAGKSFHKVVEEEGWLGFRVREYRICKGFAAMSNAVIALGGGTVRYEWNRDVMRGSGVNVLLMANLDEIADRVRPNDRPRVHPGTSLEEDLALIWGKHKEVYLGWADLTYSTDRGMSPTEEAMDLVNTLVRGGWLKPEMVPTR